MSAEFLPRAWLLQLIEITTIGLPFCAFKLLVGLHLVSAYGVAGGVLIGLGAFDVVYNVANLLTVATTGQRRLPVCTTQALTLLVSASPRARDVGSALDTLLSFSLVASMIGAGQLAALEPAALNAWNLAVILNVLGAGVLRLFNALEPK